MNERRRTLWLTVAASHLCLVTLGASSVRLYDLGLPGRVLHEYGALSGANSGYGFFAPGITSQLGARFDVVGPHGAIARWPTAVHGPVRANLRRYYVTPFFRSSARRCLAISLPLSNSARRRAISSFDN